jgi:hypothetical protein
VQSSPAPVGRPPVEMSDAQGALLNEVFAVVFYTSHGYAYVHDRLNGEKFRYIQFEKRYGAVGRQWLAWGGKFIQYSDLGYALWFQDAPPVSAEAEAFVREITRSANATSTAAPKASATPDADRLAARRDAAMPRVSRLDAKRGGAK